MEIFFYLATICLILFMILATYDGFYLHLFKYHLFNRAESAFEHKTHTVRAVLFPLIVWFLFINETSFVGIMIGMVLVVLDVIVLAIDAHSEQESRGFMGGLPKSEYIIHLFSNAFHFAAIILVLGLKLTLFDSGIRFISGFHPSFAYDLFLVVSINVIPGALVLALLHLVLLFRKPQLVWNNYRSKISCC